MNNFLLFLAIMASAYSMGQYPDPHMVTTSVNNSCTTSFSGTSSSVSVAGGVLALALQVFVPSSLFKHGLDLV